LSFVTNLFQDSDSDLFQFTVSFRNFSITSDDYDILSETERRNKELVEQYNFATPDDSLRATIKELATQRAITQRELADYVGVRYISVSRFTIVQ
jgi:predicted XRE-type DNA-binding protein